MLAAIHTGIGGGGDSNSSNSGDSAVFDAASAPPTPPRGKVHGVDGVCGYEPAVMFSMQRTYTAEEGAAYAAATAEAAATTAAAAARQLAGNSTSSTTTSPAAAAAAAAGLAAAGGSSGSSKLVFGRVVGRHRMDNNRVLVVGLHKLPPPWELPEEAQGAQPTSAPSGNSSSSSSDATSSSPSSPTSVGGLGAVCTLDLDDFLLSSWLPATKTRGTREGVGLGRHQRYDLPTVQSDRATHLLQFDGASKNNPGGWLGGCEGW